MDSQFLFSRNIFVISDIEWQIYACNATDVSLRFDRSTANSTMIGGIILAIYYLESWQSRIREASDD